MKKVTFLLTAISLFFNGSNLLAATKRGVYLSKNYGEKLVIQR